MRRGGTSLVARCADHGRTFIAILVAITLASSASPWHTAVGAADGDDGEITDPGLIDAIQSAPNDATRIVVEVVTGDTGAARSHLRALAGIVTGSITDELLQVSIPVGQLEHLAAVDAVQMVRRPLIANRPVTATVEYGPITGQNVAIINAAAWHAAGITGAGVKIGIVDFFDLSMWDPAENGPVPDAAHRLCIDNSGSGFCPSTGADGEEHGVAVAEVLIDVAPDAELFLATVGTASDLQVAIDWFATNGVSIITRSLGAAYDGPGDGSGPLAAVVDHATAKGITWFNSAGNDAGGAYGRFSEGTDANGYVDFQPGPGVDTSLQILDDNPNQFATCLGFDGVRWSDWGKAASQMTDYAVEVWVSGLLEDTIDARQSDSGQPLEAQDYYVCAAETIEVRVRRVGGGNTIGDIVEVGLFIGELEYSNVAYSAAKPVVDSRSPALISVGAIDPPSSGAIGFYSSHGPTNDGRAKPDVSAPSCLTNSIYSPCFNGTSAASPSAAGMAALLYQRGLAGGGAHLAALVKHLVTDLGAAGLDNVYGAGRISLPAPSPATIDARPTQYQPLTTPNRILDTRATSATPGARVGPHPPFTIIDLPIGLAGATAVAISIVSVDSVAPGYVQALPTLMGRLADSSSVNVSDSAQVQPNLAIVPVGAAGSITLYLNAGGNVIVDLLGSFTPAATSAVSSGRFVPIDPVRVLDTRPESAGPTPPGYQPHMPTAGETIEVTGIPAGASAVVINVTTDRAQGSGFLRAQPTGASGLTTSNGNFVAGPAAGTLSIVPVGANGTISIFTSQSTHLVADLLGWFTGGSAPASTSGLFVPLPPARVYDSRSTPAGVHVSNSIRTIQMTGAAIPADASAVSTNLTADAAEGPGYLTAYSADLALPATSSLNYATMNPRANAGIVTLGSGGRLNTLVNRTTHVIIDVNGYFTGTT